jgi:hypothetical protein
MNALRKTAEQKVSASASKQVAKPRRSKDQHAMAKLIQRRGTWSMASPNRKMGAVAMAAALHSSQNARKIPAMTNTVLLAVCVVLIGFGILIIAVSSGFFMNLLGAGTIASGGSAAYLILSHQK